MPASLLRRIRFRVYQDFFMPSRLSEYERMLNSILALGYQFVPVREFARRIDEGLTLYAKTVILRHDVDSDPATARQMLRIEQSLGISSSYFFRLRTLDVPLMEKIEAAKGEASYHFEEIATVAKARGLRSRADVLQCLPEIRQMFQQNVLRIRQESGLPLTTVASHGDFVNRIIGMPNHELLDAELRRRLGILAEVYDTSLAKPLTTRVSDRPPPAYWHPHHPLCDASNAESDSVIYILVHPKQWYARMSANLAELGSRIGEGLIYQWRSSIRAVW